MHVDQVRRTDLVLERTRSDALRRILCVPERLHRRRGHGRARRGESAFLPHAASDHRHTDGATVPFRAPEPQEPRGLLPQDCGTHPDGFGLPRHLQ